MTCKWCPSRLACVEYGCKNPRHVEVTDEMVTVAMRAFEPMSSVLRYREKDKWHTCDIMAMRDALRAVLPILEAAAAGASVQIASGDALKRVRNKRLRFIKQHYEGTAAGGPFDGCEIDADSSSVPDEQGGVYNYVGGKWIWVPGVGTDLHAALQPS